MLFLDLSFDQMPKAYTHTHTKHTHTKHTLSTMSMAVVCLCMCKRETAAVEDCADVATRNEGLQLNLEKGRKRREGRRVIREQCGDWRRGTIVKKKNDEDGG